MIQPARQSSLDWARSLQGIDAALRRAALRAREIARRTGTPLVTYRDGRICKEYVSPDHDLAATTQVDKDAEKPD
jgi:hypothetical protein